MRVRLIVLISLLVFCCKSEIAQSTSRSSAAAAHGAVDQTTFLVTPFDSSRSSLGPDFKGHNIAAVFRAIDQSPALKDRGEFEINSAFEARRATFEKVPLYGHVLTASTLAFVLPVDPDGSSFSYDPDSERVDVYVPAVRQDSLRRVMIKRVQFDDGSYVAGNAFNAKVRVNAFHIDEYGVRFSTRPSMDEPTLESEHPLVSLSIPLNEAMRVKPSLRVLLVCRLVDPWIDTDDSLHEATITEPEKWTVYYNNLDVVLLSLWVFDQRTGKVLEKVSAGSKPYPEECLHRDGSEGMQACLNRVEARQKFCLAQDALPVEKCEAELKATEGK